MQRQDADAERLALKSWSPTREHFHQLAPRPEATSDKKGRTRWEKPYREIQQLGMPGGRVQWQLSA